MCRCRCNDEAMHHKFRSTCQAALVQFDPDNSCLVVLVRLPFHFLCHIVPTQNIRCCCHRQSSVVCASVCLLVTFLNPAETAEPIEMLFDWGKYLEVVWPIGNPCCSVCSKGIIQLSVLVCGKRHSLLHNGMTARLLQPTAMLQLVCSTLHCPSEKSAPSPSPAVWHFVKIL